MDEVLLDKLLLEPILDIIRDERTGWRDIDDLTRYIEALPEKIAKIER